jgi:hypothetical protein
MNVLGWSEAASGFAPLAQRVRRDISGADNTPHLTVPLAGLRVAEVEFILAGVLIVVGRAETLGR